MVPNAFQFLNVAALVGGVSTLGLLAAKDVTLHKPQIPIIGGLYQRSVEADFESQFPLSDFSRATWNGVQLAVFNQTHENVVHTDDGWLFTIEEFEPPSANVSFTSELNRAIARLTPAGIQLIPVIVPDKARIYSDKLPLPRIEGLENRYAAALRTLDQARLPALDLRPTLSDLRQDHESFLRTDTHWSPRGAEAVAANVANLVGDLEPRTAFVTTWNEPLEFDGDLQNFVELGPFQTWIGFSPEKVSIPETSDVDQSMTLFGGQDIPVTLVGTSYSAKAEFNFEGFLKESFQADVLNVSQVGRGPFEPMRDYLASQEFKDTPPQIIIWEIPERYIPLKDFDQ